MPTRRARRYRYYVSQRLVTGGKPSAPNGRRLPAGDLERLVIGRVRDWLADEAAVFHAIEPLLVDVDERQAVLERAAAMSERWPELAPSESKADHPAAGAADRGRPGFGAGRGSTGGAAERSRHG